VVVNIDNKLDADVLAEEGISIPFVGPDNRAGAKKVGDYLASHLEPGDEVVILEGIRSSMNAARRLEGFRAAMQEAGIEVVDSQSAEWEMSRANTVASSMLSEHPGIDAILAANDSMALGAVAAVQSAGRSDDVLIVGFDNISAIRDAIRDDKVLATADQYADRLAVYGIETALELLANPEAAPEDVETPVDLVTAETLATKR
jgi:ribose transport system substrate-binding protein